MNKEKSKKELLEDQIQQVISRNKERVDFAEKYKTIMNTPVEKLIAEHIESGSRSVKVDGIGIIDLNTELLIRLLLK